MKDRNKLINFLKDNFGWSMEWSIVWLNSHNLLFDNQTPEEMLKQNKLQDIMYRLLVIKQKKNVNVLSYTRVK